MQQVVRRAGAMSLAALLATSCLLIINAVPAYANDYQRAKEPAIELSQIVDFDDEDADFLDEEELSVEELHRLSGAEPPQSTYDEIAPSPNGDKLVKPEALADDATYTATAKFARGNAGANIEPAGTWGTCEWAIEDGVLHVYPGTGTDLELYPDVISEFAPWWRFRTEIRSVEFHREGDRAVVLPPGCCGLFRGLSACSSIDLSGCDASEAYDLGFLFRGCSNLVSVDLAPFAGSHPSNVLGMFQGCKSLAAVDLSPLDTSDVSIFSMMFRGCKSLESLDLSALDASKANNFAGMFRGCSSLESLDLSVLGPLKGYRFDHMFRGCKRLRSLELPRVDGKGYAGAGHIEGMFWGCEKLESIDLSQFRARGFYRHDHMFYKCKSLRSVDLSSFASKGLVSMDEMFRGCTGLRSVKMGRSSLSDASLSGMFRGCPRLRSVDLSSVKGTVYYSDYMFKGCRSLARVDIRGLSTSDAWVRGMFAGCRKLRQVTLGKGFSFAGRNYAFESAERHENHGCVLPRPAGSAFTGNWHKVGSGLSYDAENLARAYDADPKRLAGTWRWERR